MIRPNDNICKQAEPYYYDLLQRQTPEVVPCYVVDHTEQCAECQQNINRLKKLLSEVPEYSSQKTDASDAIAGILRLHFSYAGVPVICKTAKPFIPVMLISALVIKIPTPITAHLDNCRECREDLDTIRRLNLNPSQLSRLSELFTRVSDAGSSSCEKGRSAAVSFVTLALEQMDAKVLKHLCTCPVCRDSVFRLRQKVIQELSAERDVEQQFPCQQVGASDIFDYVVPYGIDPARDQYAKFRTSLTSHLLNCSECLKKLQRLHKSIYDIAERPDSEVATILDIDESAKAEEAVAAGDIYAAFPVKVQVTSRSEQAPVHRFRKTKLTSRVLKPALTAAAVILVAAAIFLNIQSAGAITLEQICAAIEKVRNIHISSVLPDDRTVIQEQWISRPMGLYITKTGNETTVLDAVNGVKKTRQADRRLAEETLALATVERIEQKITGSVGLMPFESSSQTPPGAEWTEVTNAEPAAIHGGVDIYELSWSQQINSDLSSPKKWRVFLDPASGLPKRAEWYVWNTDDGCYILETVMVIEYPRDDVIRSLVEEMPF